MQNIQFSFLNQAAPVEELLRQCMALVDHLPAHETGDLVAAMRVFESATVPYYFDLDDTKGVAQDEDGNEISLTVGEQREALNRFAKYTEHHESDQVCLDRWLHIVLSERKPHIQVEYDTTYTGGEYSGTGETVLIPLDLIEAFEKEGSDEPVDAAFRKLTHMDSMHIVSYSLDELYNEHGERVEAPLHGMSEKLECAGCVLPTQVDEDGLCNGCHNEEGIHACMPEKNRGTMWKEISDALGFDPSHSPSREEMANAIKAMRQLIHFESKIAFELECILSEGYSGRWFDSAHDALHHYQNAINQYAEATAWGDEP